MLNLLCLGFPALEFSEKNTDFQIHYLGEVENIDITLWQIYSGHHVSNFVRNGRVL